MTARRIAIEICVEDLEGVAIARAEGADRVEFCRDLACGGLTPDPGDLGEALARAPRGGLQVLIRSRAGDFVYADAEIDAMCESIREFRSEYDACRRSAPRLGFVVGALSPEGRIDDGAATRFREAAGALPLTFHRAFDRVADQHAGLERLVDLGYERVLTTGGHETIADPGALAALIEQAGDRVAVIVSGGLRSGNIAGVLRATRAAEVHMRAPSHDVGRTDPVEVRRFVRAVREFSAT